MTKFYTTIFILFWELVLIIFSLGTLVGGYQLYTKVYGNANWQDQMLQYIGMWFGAAVFLGMCSLGISIYKELVKANN